MITPLSVAFHVTYTCPLTCKHCCFSSSPHVKDRLEPAFVLDAIARLPAETIRLVAFTGGEPFLLGPHLVSYVRAARSRGFATRIVTSAYFGRSPEAAAARLAPVADAGLDELSISWDDYHEEFVSFDCVRHTFFAARDRGIRAAVNCVQGRRTAWTAGRIRAALGLAEGDECVVAESSLNFTGRARESLADSGIRPDRFIGPCPYVMTGPTMSAKGKLLACCGVLAESEPLVIDHQPTPATLEQSMQRGANHPLYHWLHLRGPYEIAAWIARRWGAHIPPREAFGGNCEACEYLFSTPELTARLPEALAEMADCLADELTVLEAAGLGDPKSIMRLWEARSVIHGDSLPELAPCSYSRTPPLAPVTISAPSRRTD